MSEVKTPHQVRLDILYLAREMAVEEFKSGTSPNQPTTDVILAKASVLNDFVSYGNSNARKLEAERTGSVLNNRGSLSSASMKQDTTLPQNKK